MANAKKIKINNKEFLYSDMEWYGYDNFKVLVKLKNRSKPLEIVGPRVLLDEISRQAGEKKKSWR